jgi:hypothetical protein
MTPRLVIASGALGAALALPAGASAAQIRAAVGCAKANAEVTLSGSGFTPDTTVDISGNEGADFVTTDAAGNFSDKILMPPHTGTGARKLTLVAKDSRNPALTAQTELSVVEDFFITNFPVAGRPSQTVQWRFAGFVPGKPIYGHYRHRGRTLRNYRFGVASGPCGTLTLRARRLPVRSRTGRWTVQFDQASAYNRFTKPRRTYGFTIFKS